MPLRKPPKKLSTTCTAVISSTVLDVIVQVEQSIYKYCNSSIKTCQNDPSVCDNEKISNDQFQMYYDKEYQIAKYLLSSIPKALISIVILEIIKEFSSRWSEIIKLSEKYSCTNRNSFYVDR